jgi:mono/diheme cytochrome c family protein
MWATNLKVIGVVVGTLFVYTLICNKIPQMQSEVPQKLSLGANATPEQLAAAGEKVFNGVGGCTACHGLGTRAPNLLTDEKGTGQIGARCGKRESGKSCKQYLFESLNQPGAFVAPGYQPIMPVITKIMPPEQIWALVAYLESLGGTVDVTGSDVQAAAPAGGAAPAAGGAPAAFAGGSDDPKAIIKEAECANCHKINGEGADVGPDLSHVGGRRDAAAIRKKILDPASSVTKGFETMAGIMPKDFGSRMNAAQLEALVIFLVHHK